jgi:hypothetical protein
MKFISAAALCFVVLYLTDAAFAGGAYFRAFFVVGSQMLRAINPAWA